MLQGYAVSHDMESFIKLTGKDTYFVGDINNIKALWHENIKFYDLHNYFPSNKIEVMCKNWLDESEVSRLTKKSKNKHFVRTFMVFELAKKFISDLSSLRFQSGPNIKAVNFDFYQY